MADAAFKLSLFYEHSTERSAGWSESWYTTQSNLVILAGTPGNRDASIARRLAGESMLFHGRTAVVKYIRVTSVFTPRQSVVVPCNFQFNDRVPDTLAFQTDQSSTAFNLRLIGGLGKSSDHQIRGIPDGAIANNGRFVYFGDMAARVEAFFRFLQTNSFVIRYKDELQPKKPIEALTQTGQITVTAHGLVTGDYVRVGLVKGITQANGIWRVNRVDENVIQLRFFIATTSTLQKSNSAYVQKITYDSVGPDAWDVTFGTSRKVGRPTRVRVGRRMPRAI